MSTTIESKVVELKFNNSDFERNVSQSMNTVAALKKNLNFGDDASSAFSKITSAAGNVDVSSVTESVSRLHQGFSALEIAGITAISNITTRLMGMGERMAKTFTIEPVMTGWSEYETKIGAVQTILANTQSKGSTIDDVDKALEELNKYADLTIYNFTEMTKNIGTFTAAGVGLDESVNAIKGIANLAAVSGSTSQQASTAMYQLSQALAAGKVSLQDWNSVVNAGMGGEVFQNALKETSRAMGTGVDEAIEKYGTFRESLTQGGWLTKEVLTTTLNAIGGAYDEAKLKSLGFTKEQAKAMLELSKNATEAATVVKTGSQLLDTLKESAQSGWTTSWEIIVGNFEEAKKFWSDWFKLLSKEIEASAEARNSMLKSWKQNGGRDAMVESLTRMVKNILNVFHALRDGFRDVFPRITGKNLAELTKQFRDFVKNVSPSKRTLEGLKGIMHGLATILKILLIPLKLAFKIASIFVAPLLKISSAIIQVLGAIGNLIYKVLDLGKLFEWIGPVLDWCGEKLNWLADHAVKFIESFAVDKIMIGVKWLGDAIAKLIKKIKELWDNFWSGPPPDFSGVFDVLKAILGGIVTAFNAVKNAAVATWNKLSDWGIVKVLQKIWDVLKGIGGAIKEYFVEGFSRLANGDFSTVVELLAGLGAVGVGKGIHTLFKNFNGFLKSSKDFVETMKGIKGIMSQFVDALTGPLQALQTKIKAEAIWTIAKAIALLAAAMILLTLVDPQKLLTSTAAITALVVDLMGAMNTIGGVDLTMKSTIESIGMLTGIALSVLILAGAIKKIGAMKPEQLALSVAAVSMLLYEMVWVAQSVNGLADKEKKSVAGLTVLLGIVFSVRLLVGAIKKLGAMQPQNLIQGVMAVAALLFGLTMIIERLSDKQVNVEKAGMNLLVMTSFAFAVSKIAKAVQRLSKLTTGDLIKGLGGISVLLYALTLMIEKLGADTSNGDGLHNATIFEKLALMAVITATVTTVVIACKKLGSMNIVDIAEGIGGVIVLLAVMTMVVERLGQMKATRVKSASAAAEALIILSGAMYIVAMAVKKLGNMHLVDLIEGVVAFAVGLAVMVKALNSCEVKPSTAASFVILASALYIIAMAFKKLRKLSFGDVVVALIALAGGIIILAVAAGVLEPHEVALRSFATTLIMLAGAALLFSLAMVGMAAALTMVASLTGAALTAAVVAIKAIIVAIISMIPAIVAAIIDGIETFFKSAASLLGTFAGFVTDVIKTFLSVITDLAPTIISTVFDLIMAVLNAINNRISKIVDILMSILIKIINGISVRLPELIEAVLGLIMNLINGVLDFLNNAGALSFDKLLEAVLTMGAMLLAAAGFVAVGALAIAGITVAAAAIAELIALLTAVGAISLIPGLEWLVTQGGKFLKTIGDAIGGFIGGFIGGVVEGFSSHLPGIGSNLSAFMTNIQPFIEGISKIDDSILTGMERLAGAIFVLTASELLDALTSWLTGGRNIVKFGEDIAAMGPNLATFAESTAGINPATVVSASTALETLAKATATVPRKGGMIGFFLGDHDWDGFADNIGAFGAGIKEFNDNMGDIKTDRVTNGAKALEAIARGTNVIPKKSGLLQLIIGNTDFDGFKSSMGPLGTGINEFTTNLGDIKLKRATAGADVLKAICEGCAEIPASGGLLQELIGGTDISGFVGQMGSMGGGIASFAASLVEQKDNLDVAVEGANVFAAITEAVGNIPDTGAWQAVFGGKDVESFAKNLPQIGIGLKSFSNIIGSGDGIFGFGMQAYDAQAAFDAVSAFVKIVNAVAKVDKIPDDIDQSIVKLGMAIASFNLSTKFLKAPDDSTVEGFTSFIDQLCDSIVKLKDIDTSSLDGLGDMISNINNIGSSIDTTSAVSAANAAGASISKAFSSSLNDSSGISSATAAGNAYAKAFTSAVGSPAFKLLASTAAKGLVSSAQTGVKGHTEAFTTAGNNAGKGFVNGLTWNYVSATTAGKTLAKKALEAAKKALDEHSPSKEMFKVGSFAGEGLVNGINAWNRASYAAGSKLANGTLDAVSKSILQISDLVDSGMDISPVISPVLDLSDVQNKAGLVSSMLSGTRVGARFNAISSNLSELQNGATNDDVVDAVNKLNNTIDNLNGNTYNINGITYDDGSNIATAVQTLARAAVVGRRI